MSPLNLSSLMLPKAFHSSCMLRNLSSIALTMGFHSSTWKYFFVYSALGLYQVPAFPSIRPTIQMFLLILSSKSVWCQFILLSIQRNHFRYGMVLSNGSPLNTFQSIIPQIFYSYRRPRLCPLTEPLNMIGPLGRPGGDCPRPRVLLQSSLLSDELQLSSG